MKLTIFFLLFFGRVFSTPFRLFDLQLNEEWVLYKNKFNKTYESGEEELYRRFIWEDNLRYIQKHNIEYNLGQHTFNTGVNQFTDLSFKEFQSMYLPNKFPIEKEESAQYYMPPLNVEDNENPVDWRLKGYVTQVKNQGKCGSCWAFSSTGSFEGQHYRKKRILISMSEQQLVDCSTKFGNHGCNGGNKQKAFEYIKAVGGIESEKDYPYKALQMPCRFNKSKVVAKVKKYVTVPQSEALLASAVSQVGPVSIAIDAGHPSFQHYRSGIYNEPKCSSTTLDHAVLIVGYGTNEAKQSYWIVKNSWGVSWGQRGYIHMSKDKNNQCGVATRAGFPLV